MQYRILGNTGIRVSAICFGVLTIGPLQAGMKIQDGAEVISYALERGINFLDTAESYGTYPYIREALAVTGFKPVITSKSYAFTWEGMKESVERARDEMGLATIDIFMLHEQESEKTLEGHRGALEYLVKAKQQGLIRAVGISTHSVSGVMAAADHPAIEVIHPLINEAGIGIIDGTPTTMAAAIQYARLRGKGLYAMKALGGGNLLNRAYQALRYVLIMPGLASVAIGMKSKDEVDLNISWFNGVRNPELESRVGRTKRILHIESWCTGCGSCVEVCRYQALTVQEGRTVADQRRCALCGYCAPYCPDFCIKII